MFASNAMLRFREWLKTKKLNSMVWVRERTIPTERPPLIGEVIANFVRIGVPRGQRDGSLRPYSRFSRQETLLFYQVAPQLYSRGWVDLFQDPLLFFYLILLLSKLKLILDINIRIFNVTRCITQITRKTIPLFLAICCRTVLWLLGILFPLCSGFSNTLMIDRPSIWLPRKLALYFGRLMFHNFLCTSVTKTQVFILFLSPSNQRQGWR
jgi:hypothetical protein